MNEDNSPFAGFTFETDDKWPAGIVVIDGQPYPIVEFSDD